MPFHFPAHAFVNSGHCWLALGLIVLGGLKEAILGRNTARLPFDLSGTNACGTVVVCFNH